MTEKNIFKISLILAFIEGSMVLAIELMGAKIIAAFYGTSFFVWTSVLGITLTSLTLGYYFGARLSLKKNLKNILWTLFVASSVFIFFIPVFSEKILTSFLTLDIKWGSVMSSSFLLGPPLICFGSISPLLIQLNSTNISYAGKIAGFIYAVSTVGGILAAFLFGFWVIPSWGISTPLILIVIIMLLSVSVLLFDKKLSLISISITVIISFLLASGILLPKSYSPNVQISYLSEGILGQLKVKDFFNPQTNTPMRSLLINEIPQTYNLNAEGGYGLSAWKYPHIISMIASLKKAPGATALVCGFGGGAIAHELQRLGFTLDIVEIDKRMKDIGINYFYFNPSTSQFIIDDARHYINTCEKKYDLIVIDLLNGEIQPPHLFTLESFQSLKKLLHPNSLVILNYQGPADIKRGVAFESIFNTCIKAGLHTYYWSMMEDITADILFYLSLNPVDFSKLSKEKMNFCCSGHMLVNDVIQRPYIEHNRPFNSGIILTDNQPILENLNTEAILIWRKRMIKETNKHMKAGMQLFK